MAAILAAALPAAAGGTAGMSLGSILSLGLTGASAFGQIMAGQQQAAISRFQAKQSDMQAKLEGLKGREQSLQIRQKLERDLASASASLGARGMLAGEGSALAAVQAGKERASQDINAAQFGAANAADAARAEAAQLRAQANSQKVGGFIGAAGTIGSSRVFGSLLT